ncbi:GNAT family N-acetyltransferase [Clostridium pasteurianum]|uniref:GNAT family N-acetyltransferase n=1 Tax=Clostridium pasteurianum TaxID=1501 RepID=UPI0022610326|nr:GNAT family N-acetyltransferase [Clostridium pasteurianum]UZW15258.1 GNAT family N-acetyltransferase [Clostridium pasteurianum]
MNIREVEKRDLKDLLELYMQLHDNIFPKISNNINLLWERIIDDKDHHILVGTLKGKIISSCVVVIIPNLTHNQQPYALIENVITDEMYRQKGYATALLNYAKNIALDNNCYKIMLLTGSKKDSTLNFYEQAGFNRKDKTAFIQWV